MRRIGLLVLVFVLVGATGCMSPETKGQWGKAFGDLSGDNTKNIAPIK